MKINYYVRPKNGKYHVMMRVVEFTDVRAVRHHDLLVQTYESNEEAHDKALRLTKASLPLVIEMPMRYTRQHLTMPSFSTPQAVSPEAK